MNDVPDDQIGSAAEEAAKLFSAFSDWAQDHRADATHGVAGLFGHLAGAARDVNEHLATGARECTYCPICRTVHVFRSASPEVREHLLAAGASLAAAAAELLATAVPPRAERPASGVEHIDLDDEDWPEED